jgi:ubiquitin carboxyl-terminal hydrolase 8
VNESKKILPPIIKNTNQIISEQKPSQSTPYIPGLCGLINIGNTCFMNSALQCLSNIPELTQWAKAQTQNSSTQNNDIIYVYTSLIQSMWSGKYDKINPRNIKEIISHSAPIFGDYGQKDSHEFLNSLLNALERSNSRSIISNLFHIHTQSQVTCTGCHFIDLINEITTFLPLPLPKKTSNNQEISLENLINDYCLEENLDGLYYCHSCQKYTQAKQKTNIFSPLPRVLIIQLKRFPFDNTYQKIDTFIRYKLQYQNLISNNDIYQLCAVSSHVGNLASGHYTTLAKNNPLKQWYQFNDSRIEKMNFDSVITSNAYVLVYLKSEEFDSLIS